MSIALVKNLDDIEVYHKYIRAWKDYGTAEAGEVLCSYHYKKCIESSYQLKNDDECLKAKNFCGQSKTESYISGTKFSILRLKFDELSTQQKISEVIDLERASAEGVWLATYTLGGMYFYGDLIEKDILKSLYFLEYYINSTPSNYRYSVLMYAAIQYDRENCSSALRHLKLHPNDFMTYFALGNLYYSGTCATKNFYLAKSNYQKAVDLNHDCYIAYIALGMLHEELGDLNQAIFNYKRSLDIKNNGIASLQLARIHYDLNQESEFINFLELSAQDYNNPIAHCVLGHIKYRNNSSKDEGLAHFYSAAETNFPEALFMLGVHSVEKYTYSYIYSVDLTYLEKASTLGHGDAFFYLGRVYELGEVVFKDYAKAISYYEEGMRNGSAAATYRLAMVAKDISNWEEAISLYSKAIEFHNNAPYKCKNKEEVEDERSFFEFISNVPKKQDTCKNEYYFLNKFSFIGKTQDYTYDSCLAIAIIYEENLMDNHSAITYYKILEHYDDVNILFKLANLYESIDDCKSAVSSYERIHTLYPGYKSGYAEYRLAVLYDDKNNCNNIHDERASLDWYSVANSFNNNAAFFHSISIGVDHTLEPDISFGEL